MQAREIRNLTNEEINARLEDAYRELFALRQGKSMGRLEDHNQIRRVKGDISRMKTILREREIGAELIEGGE